MQIRVDHLKRRRSGDFSRREEHFDQDSVSIGRGSDNDLTLKDLSLSLRHAQFRLQTGRILYESVGADELVVNGEGVAEAAHFIEPGDRIQLGRFELRVLDSGAGEELRCELEEREPEMKGEVILDVGVRRGLYAAAAVLGLFIVAVLWAMPLRSGMLEFTWDSGPISRSHAFIASDCKRCHDRAFERVRDQQCLECHASIGAHGEDSTRMTRLEETRCASCHMEHNGAHGLADLEQALCADCHRTLGEASGTLGTRDVSDFEVDHPEFRIALAGERGGAPIRERVEWHPGLREKSGIKFNHENHVGRYWPGGKKHLDCGHCHRLDLGGRNNEPIEFEKSCQNEGCHNLSFDDRADAQALHGEPSEMRSLIRGFYFEQEMRTLVAEVRGDGIRRRRVGQDERKQRARLSAAEKSRAANAFLMDLEKPGECVRCHLPSGEPAADGELGLESVHLTTRWMPLASFRHAAHKSFSCRGCHARASVYNREALAEGQVRPEWSMRDAVPFGLLTPAELREEFGLEPSHESADVLVPGIELCQNCHGGAEAESPFVASECVLCHPFHRDEYGPLHSAGLQSSRD